MDRTRPGRIEHGLQAALAALAALAAALLLWQLVDPTPRAIGPLTIDRLSALTGTLVAGIGAVCYRFAMRYLRGEPGQRQALRWMAATIAAALGLMFASHLIVLFIAWAITSLGLHHLLTFYGDRPAAQRAARKKFLISRLGDAALLAAIGLIWAGWGTFDLHTFLGQLAAAPQPAMAGAVALLIAVAALTKSAQLPFHSWLPETMEAPTPVSALMHAGIINAGGVLLIRFAPLLAEQAGVLLLLSAVGTLTLLLAVPAMWAQPDVKRALAWSTIGQMGFMMIQLGLGAFAPALLHMVGHGCYKAWSFLRSGELPAGGPASPPRPGRALALLGLGALLAGPALALAAGLVGLDLRSPGKLALAALVALAIGQLWAALLGGGASARRLLAAAALTPAIALLAATLSLGAERLLAPVVGPLPAPGGPLAWAAALPPLLALLALSIWHACQPLLGRTAAGRALRVHALNGWYIGAIASRLVDQLWALGGRPAQPAPARDALRGATRRK